jgi:hypothetical protein
LVHAAGESLDLGLAPFRGGPMSGDLTTQLPNPHIMVNSTTRAARREPDAQLVITVAMQSYAIALYIQNRATTELLCVGLAPFRGGPMFGGLIMQLPNPPTLVNQ